MRNYRTVAMVLILVGLLSVPAQAQVIPGRWEKIEALQLGPQITVELENGNRIEGQFEGLSPSEFLLRTGSAQAAISRAEIRRITTRGHDPLTDGILLGAGIGGGIMGAIFGSTEDISAEGTVFAVLIGAGLGTLIGLGADAIPKGGRCVAPRPKFLLQRGGVVLSANWQFYGNPQRRASATASAHRSKSCRNTLHGSSKLSPL